MREISADTDLLLVRVVGRSVIACIRIAEVYSFVRVRQNRFYPRPALPIAAKHGPSHFRELLGIAISASQKIDEYLGGQLSDRMLVGANRERLGCAAVADDESVPKGKASRRSFRTGAFVTKAVYVICVGNIRIEREGLGFNKI